MLKQNPKSIKFYVPKFDETHVHLCSSVYYILLCVLISRITNALLKYTGMRLVKEKSGTKKTERILN